MKTEEEYWQQDCLMQVAVHEFVIHEWKLKAQCKLFSFQSQFFMDPTFTVAEPNPSCHSGRKFHAYRRSSSCYCRPCR
jgi:hypothetical protein